LAYSGVTLYETVVAGSPGYISLVGQLNGLSSLPKSERGKTYHWAAAVNRALATILLKLYPTATPGNLAAIASLEGYYAEQYKLEVNGETFDRSVSFGQAVAEAIFEWSREDGGHGGHSKNFPESYISGIGPGLWIPTPPDYLSIPMQPYWGENRPFVIRTDEECVPGPPTLYSENSASLFYGEAMDVYTTVKNLMPEQNEIAIFWSDDPGKTFTPPGHSISIAAQVLQQEQADLALAAETFAKVGMAVADSFISCWRTKYIYNLIRPISYIQSVLDPTWNLPALTDPVITPPFPEYTSGHSVQSAAAATVLTDLFGENYRFTDNTQEDLGLEARTYNSFNEAAEEAAISRLYGGIHYRPAIEIGLAQGKCIGEKVNALVFKPSQ
jgi:hypothetical protein